MTRLFFNTGMSALFVALSLADFVLTAWLLERSGGRVVEANPVARWWIDHLGWAGLAAYKGAIVVLVLGVVARIARSRPHLGRGVLAFGCATVALVVGYSAALGASGWEMTHGEVKQMNADLASINDTVVATARQKAPFHALARQVREDLVAHRCSLRDGAVRLNQFDTHPVMRPHLQTCYADCTDEQRYATWLICQTASALQKDLAAARAVTARLEREFAQTYGRQPPEELWMQLSFLDPEGRWLPFAPGYPGSRPALP